MRTAIEPLIRPPRGLRKPFLPSLQTGEEWFEFMSQIFNYYCDESYHLEHGDLGVMTLGAVWCPAEKAHESAVRLREIKQKHGLKSHFEIKWVKVAVAAFLGS